ncbi:hypothetical protein [Acetobacter cibinongensis]|uniref:hypothetical protein n=1 Tax=Acetobacter cibinongensis TaxID=146475 RepID=UPI000A37CE19|nr:hypothetical protein [Acetobacter cibinongensis]
MAVSEYAVYRTVAVDGSLVGTVVNRVMWDGMQTWTPGEGLAVVADPNRTLRIGSVYEPQNG